MWMWLSIAAAAIGATGSGIGLLAADRIYGQETTDLADQAAAQDIVNLTLVAPLLIVLAIVAARGSLRAILCWLGCLIFTAYNYAIYAISIHFGPLFLPWVAVLGLALFTLIGALSVLDISVVKTWFAGRTTRLSGWYLIAVAVLFASLWLGEIVPDLLAGDASRSASAWQVPTNPVHVLDLAFFLPAVAISGVLLLRRQPLGYATAAGQFVFLALTCLPILLTPLVTTARGQTGDWAVVLPIGMLLTATGAVLWITLRPAAKTTTSDPDGAVGPEARAVELTRAE
jgi:hypothetical protein